MSRASVLITLLAALLVGAASAHAATIPVTTTADVVAADGLCSLREAVFAARFDQAVQGCSAGSPGDDLIQLEAATYSLAAGGADEDANESGDLDTGPTSALRVAGRGMAATVIAAAGNRGFDVFAGASLGVSDLTIRDAAAPRAGSGGAIRNKGSLTVLRVAFANDAAGDGTPRESIDGDPSERGGGGGAIQSEGQLQVADSVFSGVRAGDGADGRHFEEATPTGTRSVDSGPTAGGSGGAILVTGGTASITGSTFVGARAGDGRDKPPNVAYASGGDGGAGGAIAVTGGSATVVNSTFGGNRAGNAGTPRFGLSAEAEAGSGGAVAAIAPGSLQVTFSTFAGNAPGRGPGVDGVGASVLGATVGGSILADAGACATSSPAPLANVVLPGDAGCPGSRVAGDPRLGALVDNGGPVPTMAPGAGSPAIDLLVGVPCPAVDARGLVRPRFAGCDAGAVEVQPGSPAAPAPGGPGVTSAAASRGLSALRLAPAAFRAGGRGMLVTYRLGAPGRVVLSVRTTKPGKRLGRRCVAPTGRLRAARRCTRTVTLAGRIARQGIAGANSLRFTGRIGGRLLAPGRYTLVVTLPASAGLRAVSLATAFRVRR